MEREKPSCSLCVDYLNRQKMAYWMLAAGVVLFVICLKWLRPWPFSFLFELVGASAIMASFIAIVVARWYWFFLDTHGWMHVHRKSPATASAELQHEWFGMPFSQWDPGIAFGLKVGGMSGHSTIMCSESLKASLADIRIVNHGTSNQLIVVKDIYNQIIGLRPYELIKYLRRYHTVQHGINEKELLITQLLTSIEIAITCIKESKQTMGRSKAAQVIRQYLERVRSEFEDRKDPVPPKFTPSGFFKGIWMDTQDRILNTKAASRSES